MATTNVKGSGNTLETLNGLYKDVYGEYHDILPKGLRFQNDIPFKRGKKLGDNYVENVLLAHEHGVTYIKEDVDDAALEASIAGQTKKASLQGSQIMLRSRIGYKAAKAAVKGGQEAFKRAFDVVIDNMSQSVRKRVEIDILYGRQALCTVSAVASDVVTIDTAEWAPGMWAGMENAELEAFDAAGTTARVAGSATITIKSVDIDNKKITGTASSVPTDLVATDTLWFKTQHTTTEERSMLGLHQILTTTGTLFGIATADFSLWNASTHSAGTAQLTFPKVQKAVYKAISKGLDGDLCLYVNPNTWADLLTDEAALRRHNAPKNYDVGAEGIKFYSQNGTILIKASIYVKEGFAYLIPITKFSRVGASDITFNVLGESDSYFLWVQDRSAYEMRLYSDQALYTPCPGQSVLINNIVNAA